MWYFYARLNKYCENSSNTLQSTYTLFYQVLESDLFENEEVAPIAPSTIGPPDTKFK